MNKNDLIFKPRARLLLQLGDQLIRNESIALLELIKNAYDADASKVVVIMNNLEDPDKGEIIVEDDGIGMDKTIIEEVWMQPGSNYKQKKMLSNETSLKYKRLPIGEKGIGRFGVHKLGKFIDIVSKKMNQKEIQLKIDWSKFEKDTLLNDIQVELEERKPKYFTEGTGTRIVIKHLKNKWARGTIRDIYRAINSLSSPFETLSSFKVLFKIDKKEWLTGLLSFREIQEYALYFAHATMEETKIHKLEYNFQPWDTMNKLEKRKEVYENIRMVKEEKDDVTKKKMLRDINLSNYKIGKVEFKIMIFDRDSKILSLGISDKKGFKEYLDQNGGIKIFRDGIRIYDYGEPDNDWLSLDIKRVNRPGINISNNLIIGAINLSRSSSNDLIEKTNREGFIENEAYAEFRNAINFTLDKILTQRNIDKEKIRKFYNETTITEPITGKLRILFEKIEKGVTDKDLRKELLITIKETEKEFEEIREIFTRSSSAGLSLGIVIHELEKAIDELIRVVEKYPDKSQVKLLVNHIAKIIEDYSAVIKQSPKQKEDLKLLIDQSIFNVSFRLKAHNVKVLKRYAGKTENTSVRCSSNLVVSSLMNLFDNSLWWLNYVKREKKSILIDIIDDYQGYKSIIFIDNGPGFSISPEDAVKPFITDKPNGMGLGLHLADEVMKAQKGKLIFPEWGDISLPKEFRVGAKIALLFRI